MFTDLPSWEECCRCRGEARGAGEWPGSWSFCAEAQREQVDETFSLRRRGQLYKMKRMVGKKLPLTLRWVRRRFPRLFESCCLSVWLDWARLAYQRQNRCNISIAARFPTSTFTAIRAGYTCSRYHCFWPMRSCSAKCPQAHASTASIDAAWSDTVS